MNIPKGMKIHVAAEPGRQDSFWYGPGCRTIAMYKGFCMAANGDIRIETPDGMRVMKIDDVADECKDDRGLRKLVGSYSDLPRRKKYLWIENNWFEIFGPDGNYYEGQVRYDYDEAIKLLVEIADRDSVQWEDEYDKAN